MRTVLVSAGRGVAALLGGLLAAGTLPAQAPVPKPDVTFPVVTSAPRAAEAPRGGDMLRTEIFSGPTRTVRYHPSNASPGERAALNDLERAENEAAYANDLLALKQQYVTSERILEPYRRQIQQQLYGFNYDSTYSAFSGGGFGPGTYFNYAYPFGSGFGGYGFGFGLTNTVSRSLAYGMGDEGRFKDEMVRQIAREATPEFAASAAHGVNTALANVAESDRLRAGLGLPERGIVGVGAETPRKATVTFKDGKTATGTVTRQDGDWLLIQTPAGDINVRRSEVNRIDWEKSK
jgi:hypothetical protein